MIGARRYERSGARDTERNGHRQRTLSTKAGNVEIGIPKLTKGSFFPSILEPRRRIDQALSAVVTEAYVHGVSPRAVDELRRCRGVSTGISRSEVSGICQRLDRLGRSLPHAPARPRKVPLRVLGRHITQRARRPPRGLQKPV